MNKFELNRYLHIVGENLQIRDSKYQTLNSQYETLSNYIYNQHELVDGVLNVYQNGSFSTNTVVRPLKGEEFDVDMVVLFEGDFKRYRAKEFHEMLFNIFDESKRYGDRVEQYRNVIRIVYNDNFHFDIMPAFKHEELDKFIRVPDTKMGANGKWVSRSPKRYKEWFESRTNQMFITKSNWFIDSKGYLETRDIDQEPLTNPNESFMQKPTLQRLVQLIKRIRDIYFSQYDDECFPSSIILTTLLAEKYNGEIDVYDGLINTLREIGLSIKNNSSYRIQNPVNNKENFARKWIHDKVYYTRFKEFIDFSLENFNNLISNDIKLVKKSLTNLFGQSDIDKLKEKTSNDLIWKDYQNLYQEVKQEKNIFPDKPVEIKKKERGNAN